jgi:hypothetical protein
MQLEYQDNNGFIKKWYVDWDKNKFNKPLLIFGDFTSTLQTLTQEGQIYKPHISYQKKEIVFNLEDFDKNIHNLILLDYLRFSEYSFQTLKVFFDKFLSTQAAKEVPVIFRCDRHTNRTTRSFKYFENRFIVLLKDTSLSHCLLSTSEHSESRQSKTICHII